MRKSRLSQHKQNKLIELFVAGVTARTASELVNVNKNTAAYYFHRLRLLIYQTSPHLEMFEGEIEADESYFGGILKGKRGRGAAGKVAVFGLLKRNGKVYTVVVPNAQSATLLPIIREKVKPDSIVYTDTSLTALFTLTLTVVMMCLISANLVISASITVRILLKIITI